MLLFDGTASADEILFKPRIVYLLGTRLEFLVSNGDNQVKLVILQRERAAHEEQPSQIMVSHSLEIIL